MDIKEEVKVTELKLKKLNRKLNIIYIFFIIIFSSLLLYLDFKFTNNEEFFKHLSGKIVFSIFFGLGFSFAFKNLSVKNRKYNNHLLDLKTLNAIITYKKNSNENISLLEEVKKIDFKRFKKEFINLNIGFIMIIIAVFGLYSSFLLSDIPNLWPILFSTSALVLIFGSILNVTFSFYKSIKNTFLNIFVLILPILISFSYMNYLKDPIDILVSIVNIIIGIILLIIFNIFYYKRKQKRLDENKLLTKSRKKIIHLEFINFSILYNDKLDRLYTYRYNGFCIYKLEKFNNGLYEDTKIGIIKNQSLHSLLLLINPYICDGRDINLNTFKEFRGKVTKYNKANDILLDELDKDIDNGFKLLKEKLEVSADFYQDIETFSYYKEGHDIFISFDLESAVLIIDEEAETENTKEFEYLTFNTYTKLIESINNEINDFLTQNKIVQEKSRWKRK